MRDSREVIDVVKLVDIQAIGHRTKPGTTMEFVSQSRLKLYIRHPQSGLVDNPTGNGTIKGCSVQRVHVLMGQERDVTSVHEKQLSLFLGFCVAHPFRKTCGVARAAAVVLGREVARP